MGCLKATTAQDTFRGYMKCVLSNFPVCCLISSCSEGGLYAERIGAHLPDFSDDSWASGSPLSGLTTAGVNFYRTKFNLKLPGNTDVPIRLSITPSDITSNFRVQIYLNGWMLGKYINNFG